jgi:uncharacterized membrane protein
MTLKPTFKRFKINLPIGAIASFGILIYLIENDIWNKLSGFLKVIVVFGLILLFFCGDFEYKKEIEEK